MEQTLHIGADSKNRSDTMNAGFKTMFKTCPQTATGAGQELISELRGAGTLLAIEQGTLWCAAFDSYVRGVPRARSGSATTR